MIIRLFNKIKNYCDKIRSYVICKQFRTCGKTVRIEKLGKLIGAKFISIGDMSSIQQMTYLTAWENFRNQKFTPEIAIGDNCHIGAFNHITCVNKIEIGDGFVSGKWVTITDNSHGDTKFDTLRQPVSTRLVFSKGPVIIGRNVWVGDKATILAGVKIGDGAVVGANSVVTKDVPSYSIVGGNPAKVISYKR